MTGRGHIGVLMALLSLAGLVGCGSSAEAGEAPVAPDGPYALYSSAWTEEVDGAVLPHGAKVVLPAPPESFARSLYLLQSANLVRLDRPAGGTSRADTTITEADIVDSPRHLRFLRLSSDVHLREIYHTYDAIVLDQKQAAILGLDPAKDALAVEPAARRTP